jgi:hypothetical protein
MEVSCQPHAPAALIPGKEPSDTHFVGGRVVPRDSLDAMEKKSLPMPGIELRTSSP